MSTCTRAADEPAADAEPCLVQKQSTMRVAVASGRVLLGRAAFDLVAANAIKKGDVLTVAQVRYPP